MVFVIKLPFFQLPFARQYRPEKRLCFRYSRSKNARLGYKKRSSKSRKMTIFRKRLTHGFGPKMIIFMQYRPGQCVLRYFRTKNAFLGYKKQKLKKAKNCIFLTSFF